MRLALPFWTVMKQHWRLALTSWYVLDVTIWIEVPFITTQFGSCPLRFVNSVYFDVNYLKMSPLSARHFEPLAEYYPYLEYLDLSNLQLVAAPVQVLELTSLISLDLSGNLLQFLPLEYGLGFAALSLLSPYKKRPNIQSAKCILGDSFELICMYVWTRYNLPNGENGWHAWNASLR